MQMDGGMATAAAIQEMLLLTKRGVNYLFQGAPQNWLDVSFENMRTEGAFLVSAQRKAGTVTHVIVKSEAGGIFRIANPWQGEAVIIKKSGEKQYHTGKLLNIALSKGEIVSITTCTN